MTPRQNMRLAVLLLCFGCGDSESTVDARPTIDASVDATSDMAGNSSGTLKVEVWLDILVDGETVESCLTVYIFDLLDSSVVDAQVVMGGASSAVMATFVDDGNGYGHYVVIQPAVFEAYELSITRGTDFLTDVVFVAPPVRTVTMDRTPALSTPLWVNWTSVDRATLTLDLGVSRGVEFTYYGNDLVDDGVEYIPPSAFPTPDVYAIFAGWRRELILNSPESIVRGEVVVQMFYGMIQ